ncbi:MAG: acyl-CoA thioesterase FadM [Phenylobacterium sp.]|jgi:acyl-CoA thioesterase FadM
MNLYLRLFWILITAKFRPKAHLLATTKIKGRILPNDLDINMHVNNGRYLSIADLGRVDYMVKTGFMNIMIKRKWKPIVASVNARYVKGLTLMQEYELTSKLLCWDEKWGYFEHRFERNGKLIAVVYIKGLFVGPDGRVAVGEAAKALGVTEPSPAMPDEVKDLRDQKAINLK